MAYEIKDNTGSLFINDKREKDTHPNFKGSAKIDGKEYWISAWSKTSSNGKEFTSISFQSKDAVHAQGVAKVKAVIEKPAQLDTAWDDSTDSIPF